MSRTNETHHMSWHETCACKCRLDSSVCNDKQRWNRDKCRCECKELINQGKYDDGFICNPSICECECDKSRDVGEYLDYVNFKCRERLIDGIVRKYDEGIDEYDYGRVCKSFTLYIVLSITVFIRIMSISGVCFYYYWNTIKNYFNKLSY